MKTIPRKSEQPYMIPNIAKAMTILDYMAKTAAPLGMSEMAGVFDYSKNSVFRVMKTLEYYGYVEEQGGKYLTTPRMLYLGYASLSNTGLIENSMESLYELRDEANETVMLGSLLANHIVIVEQLVGFQMVKFSTEIGKWVSIHASAPGKAIAAYLPEEQREELITKIEFQGYTKSTITGAEAFRRELLEVRSLGYGLDDEEEAETVFCIAAPVFDHENSPCAAIWLAGPTTRMNRETIDRILPPLHRAAEKISRRFGFCEVYPPSSQEQLSGF